MSQELTVQEQRNQRLASFKSQLEKQTPAFKAMLPAHVPAEKFKRVVMTAMVNAPDLLECTAQSVLTACMRAAADGLLPDGREGAVVKFKDKAQWMPMVGGILKKLRNSGEILSINAYCVYKNDKFRYVLGDDEKIEHVPYVGEDPGDPIAVYAIARTKDGGVYREVMTKAQVEKVRAVSRSDTTKPDSPWVKWWDEKARVACIRRLSKRLPMSTDREEDLRAMLEREDEPDMQDVTTSAGDQAPEPRPTRDDFKPEPEKPITETDERAADRMMARAQAGEDPTEQEADNTAPAASDATLPPVGAAPPSTGAPTGATFAAVDLTAIAMPMKDDKPDVAAYTTAINAALAKLTSITEIAEFDAANKPVAMKAGGSIVRNYGVAIAQAKARVEAQS